jgi:hypothetical protein
MRRLSAKIKRRNKQRKPAKKPLDMISKKKRRGRPPRVRVNEITGHAYNNRIIFNQVWDSLWPLLSKAHNKEDVDKAFRDGASIYYQRTDVWSPALAFEVLGDPKFPKRRNAQINFFAESLAGLGEISPRYSRDICARERAKDKHAHRILRFEFYIECSCTFKGRSRDHGCPKCGTKIDFPWRSTFPF